MDDKVLALLNTTVFLIKLEDEDFMEFTDEEIHHDTINVIDRIIGKKLKTKSYIWDELDLNENIVSELEENPESVLVEFKFQFTRSEFNKFKITNPEFYEECIQPRKEMLELWAHGPIQRGV